MSEPTPYSCQVFLRRVHLESVDSTNSYVAALASEGEPEGLVVTSEEQRAGRGRRGRSWVAPHGGAILCSLLFRPRLSPDELHLIPSLVALGALEAIEKTTGVTCSLKWPNDLTLGEQKVAGILAELVEETNKQARGLIVGIGVNVAFPAGYLDAQQDPEIVRRATTLVEHAGRPLDKEVITDALLHAIDRRYVELIEEKVSPVELMTDYRRTCRSIGRLVEVTMENTTLVGRVETIDDDGRLVLQSHGERHHLDVGDVVHLRE